MKEKIAVFTDSKKLYTYVQDSIKNINIQSVQYSQDKYNSFDKEGIKMIIQDLTNSSDSYAVLMKIFYVKYAKDCPVLACVSNEERRLLLNLFTFGVEDYIVLPLDSKQLETKIINILRYKRWLEKYKENNNERVSEQNDIGNQ